MFCLHRVCAHFCICICICLTVKVACRNWFRGFLFPCVCKWLFIVLYCCGQWVPGPPTRPTASQWLRTPLRVKAKCSQEFVLCVLREHLLKQVDSFEVKQIRENMPGWFHKELREIKGKFCQVLVWWWIKRIVLNRPKQIEIYSLSR